MLPTVINEYGLAGNGLSGYGMAGDIKGSPPSGWWLSDGILSANCAAAYRSKGAASLAASYINLAHPGVHNITTPAPATWASGTGWTFNGLTQYLITGVGPSSNAWSILVCFSGGSQSTGSLFGSIQSTPTRIWNLFSNYTNNKVVYQNDGTRGVTPGLNSGVIGWAGTTAYRDGMADGTISTINGVSTIGAYLGANNQDGSPNGWWAGIIESVAIYNITITDSQAIAVSTAMALF